MAAKYRLSRRAETDLMEIVAYTVDAWGANQASRYIDDLEETCRRLAKTPALGRACDYIRPGLRRIESGRHGVFYGIKDGRVLIARILHERMLPQRHDAFE